jgi:hypothetical protein
MTEEPAEEEAVEEEDAADAAYSSDKRHLLGRKVKQARREDAESSLVSEYSEASRIMEGSDVADIDLAPEADGGELVTSIEESVVAGSDPEVVEPEVELDVKIGVHEFWFCVLPTPFSMGAMGFPVDKDGNPIIREASPLDADASHPVVADEELVTVTDIPAVNPKGILLGRSVKSAAAPADPDQPSPKGILLQRKAKPAPNSAK